ncbi:MAG: sulfurtransferase-like selenium metabolism protein YedF [Spirochaetes bacterium]|nr:sulfurtransferase-like selenium metabolism protein YedF [Spirochaetota bacterium]
MKRSIIDARGELCPKPLIMSKKALEDTLVSGTFDLLLDNETSRENVERYLLDNNIDFFSSDKDEYFILTISKKGESVLTSDAEEYCSLQMQMQNINSAGHIICFKKDKMGSGDDDLGSILIKACINTIREITPLPEKIIFYNSGVKLATSSSPVIDSLKELEKTGVTVLICGTCADFYQIKPDIAVGRISNMYDILEALTSASKIIYP